MEALAVLKRRKYVLAAAMFYMISMLLLAWFRPPPVFVKNDQGTKTLTPFGMRSKYGTIFSMGIVSVAIATLAFVACTSYYAAKGDI